jgi:CheY-like chemotaxis protein
VRFQSGGTAHGEEALALAQEHQPAAITLDVHLSDVDGWTVLDRIKVNPATRHIPVYMVTVEDDRLHGLRQGAFAYLQKPVSRQDLAEAFARLQTVTGAPRTGRLLLVESDATDGQALIETIGNHDVTIKIVSSGEEVLAALKAERFDCMVLDLQHPDAGGFPVLEAMRKDAALRDIPVVVYAGHELSKKEEAQSRDWRARSWSEGALARALIG